MLILPAMHEPRAQQGELGFQGDRPTDGYRAWMEQRDAEMREKARRLGLPLGHMVEVWLKDGTLLKGRLLLREQGNNWELMVGPVGFSVAEIEACVRMD